MNNIFDRYHKRYDAWYEKNNFAYLSELEAVRKALPKSGKGLEIGVGTGRFASRLGIKFGLDPSKKMLEIARQRGVDARLGFGEHPPFKKGSFDYAAIIITLCFVKNPPEVLRQAARILRKNGRIIIGIVDKDSFLGKYYRKKESPFYKQARFLSVQEVSAFLETAGFTRLSYYQTIFKLPQKINSVQEPRKGYGDAGFVVISGIKRQGIS